MPSFTRAPRAQPSLSNLPNGTQISASRPTHAGRPDSNEIFQLPPKIKRPNLHIVRYICHCEQYQPHTQIERRAHPNWAPTREPTVSIWRYTPTPNRTASRTSWKLSVRSFCTQNSNQIKLLSLLFQHTSTVECRSCVVYAQNSIFCQFGNLEICPNFANPYLTQFSSISGGNCINKWHS